MHAKMTRLLSLSSLAVALLAASAAARADVQAPVFTAQPISDLCPAAADARNYTTRYQQNFTTLVQAKGDWLFRTQEDLRTDFNTTPEGFRRMKQLHDAFKSKGVELVVVYQPTRGLVNREMLTAAEKASYNYDNALSSYKAMLGKFEQMGYVVPDLSPLTDEHLPASTKGREDFYFRGDQHWTPYGAMRTAKIVGDTIKKMPQFDGIPTREYESRVSGRMGKNGTLHNMAAQLCGNTYAIQYMDQFTTEPKGEAADGDLFGDSGTPQITLVGTSHSGKNYNFAGFLQQYTGADVLNVAFPGGALEGAMIQYLGSEEFQKTPPKILVWEFSPLYRLDQESVFRQMMALLDNGCEGKTAQMSGSGTVNPGKTTELLVNGKNGIIDVHNGNHQIDVQFADPSVKTFQATLWYLNGRHEEIKFEKPTTADTDGRFAFELRDDADWAGQNLLALEVHGSTEPGTTPQKVEAKVCKRNVFPGVTQHTAGL